MAGPVFWILLQVKPGADPVEVARQLAREASGRGYGMIFGEDLIGHWDPSEKDCAERLVKEFEAEIVVSVTTHPLQTNVAELFDLELNPSSSVPTRDTGFVDFVRQAAKLSGAKEIVFVIAEDPWMSNELPRRRVSINEFVAHLMRYVLLQADSGAGDGIFLVS